MLSNRTIFFLDFFIIFIIFHSLYFAITFGSNRSKRERRSLLTIINRNKRAPDKPRDRYPSMTSSAQHDDVTISQLIRILVVEPN